MLVETLYFKALGEYLRFKQKYRDRIKSSVFLEEPTARGIFMFKDELIHDVLFFKDKKAFDIIRNKFQEKGSVWAYNSSNGKMNIVWKNERPNNFYEYILNNNDINQYLI